jgi:hypothetical protein
MRILIAAMVVLGTTLAAPVLVAPAAVDACAGLIGSNGSVQLGRTTTLAGYHDGVEHYVTAFEFQGGGGEFGALIPLPGVPTNVERGGDWTLQRLQQETPPKAIPLSGGVGGAALESAEVLQEVRIDALDLTVLSGGGAEVAVWAEEHQFRLSPDAPEVLDFYAQRSPIFLAAVFDGDAAAARGQEFGDGTPVHLTIPTANPWVPLRILGLGNQPDDFVFADVFLLTDLEPALLPAPGDGLFLTHSQPATDLLLSDLRSDTGMGWVPESGWLTKIQVSSSTADLQYDLAVDPSGNGTPSRADAGLDFVSAVVPEVIPEVVPDIAPEVLSVVEPIGDPVVAPADTRTVDDNGGVPRIWLLIDGVLLIAAGYVVLRLIKETKSL